MTSRKPTRSAWEEVRVSLVFPRSRWRHVKVIRVERRTTKSNRRNATFDERYTLECACGMKWRVNASVFDRRNVKDCGTECRLRDPGPTPQDVLRDGPYLGLDDPTALCKSIVRAAKAHGWKV